MISLDIAIDMKRSVENSFQDEMHKHLDSMTDVWMAFEHHEAWQRHENTRIAQETAEGERKGIIDLADDTIDAETMDEMIDKIRQLAGNDVAELA